MSVLNQVRNKIVPIRRSGIPLKETILDLGYAAEEDYLKSVIKQVVVGNSDGVKISSSIMVYGPPGVGKSQLVDKVLEYCGMDFGSESFYIVRLEGSCCFNLQDSIMEICNQMMEGGDDNGISDDLEVTDGTPFDERLEKVLFYLKNKLIEKNKSLVVVIDGMERFVDDSSQRLLYNLFDISANSVFSVPICIIGITPCVDILDSFEKRVRSRFSHRQINLISKVEFQQYQEWAKRLLSWPSSKEWCDHVEIIFAEKSVIKILRSLYEADKSIGQLKRFLYLATLHCTEKPYPSDIQEAYTQLYGEQSLVKMALDLPLCDLIVLLGIYKKIQRSQQAWQPQEIFEIVRKPYARYQLRKDDFIRSILKFQDLEIIIPVGGSKQSRINVFDSLFKCEISYSEFQDIWKTYPKLPSFFNEFL